MSVTEKTEREPREGNDKGTGGEAPQERDGLGAAGAQLSTQPVDTLRSAPAIGTLALLRWMWRQLTSMRIALVLLFLLSLAAIPGSLIPQHSDALKVEAFKKTHPGISPLYDRLGMFHVYSSPWFAAIYILLFVSLAGCIVPRTWQFVGQLRARPPAAPRHLTRLPAYSTWRTDAEPEQVLHAAHKALRGRRFRTALSDGTGKDGKGGGGSVAAEKGYLRETGNLLFHIALFGLLISFAVTSLNKAEGGKLIVEGDGFTNNLTQYDDFSPSTLYTADDLKPFGFKLDSFDSAYETSGPDIGSPRVFKANIHYWDGADGKPVKGTIDTNHPLSIGGEKVYLIGHGYAPIVTVKDAKGNVAFRGPVPFLPQDSNITSTGTIKVPDAVGKDGKPQQLAFTGYFTPTGDAGQGPRSFFPGLESPLLFLNAYHGDLGIDGGVSKNVYQLDTTKMKQFKLETSTPGINAVALKPGEAITLPDGAGSLTFTGVKTWASFQVSHQSGNETALISGVAAILGLMGSLFIQRRRIWVRAVPGPDGTTVVEMGGLGRSESVRIAEEIGDIALQLQPEAPALPDEDEDEDPVGNSAGNAETAANAETAGKAENADNAANAANAENTVESPGEGTGQPDNPVPVESTPRTDDEGARA
ncbi:cytochrome c biogenesis protein ResB [Streptomyces sp. NPDC093221]|uniref:cytochrome c biogenesis protein ResB n=1 Tax=Streptomyces sp. NPDC093221 TaxID=3366032 RepID=UPI00382830E8